MGKKILDSKILYMVLSVVIAVSLWCYVTSTDGTPSNQPIRNIPVEFTDVDILEGRGLMIISENVTVDIEVRATPAVLAKLNNQSLKVRASVSGVSETGTQSINYTVEPPDGVSASQVQFISGARGSVVEVQVAQFLRREVDVRGSFQGSVADGYLAGNDDSFIFSPATVWVSGQAELVRQVSHALVTITDTELTDDISQDCQFELIGASNDPLELDVACDVDAVYVNFPVKATADIPLEVNLIPGGGLGKDDVECRLSVDSIRVAGSRDAVTALTTVGSINLATIDLASVRDGDELVFAIPLTDELTNLSGITEARAYITVKKPVVSQTFPATNITYINKPDGWDAEIVTKEMSVEIRGTQELIDELTEENIRVVADLQNINQAASAYTVPVNIYLDSAGSVSEIGVMNATNHSVVVTLTPAN